MTEYESKLDLLARMLYGAKKVEALEAGEDTGPDWVDLPLDYQDKWRDLARKVVDLYDATP